MICCHLFDFYIQSRNMKFQKFVTPCTVPLERSESVIGRRKKKKKRVGNFNWMKEN